MLEGTDPLLRSTVAEHSRHQSGTTTPAQRVTFDVSPRIRCVLLALAHLPADQAYCSGLTSRKMILCEDAQHPIEFNLGLTNLVVLPTVEVSFFSNR